MFRGISSLLLLTVANGFMTLAWYGHLQFSKMSWYAKSGMLAIILISWGIAFFEYCFQVPANRIGFAGNGGPFNLFQLKVLQEIISLVVFTGFAVFIFKTDRLAWNHLVAFLFLVLAVFFAFKKW